MSSIKSAPTPRGTRQTMQRFYGTRQDQARAEAPSAMGTNAACAS